MCHLIGGTPIGDRMVRLPNYAKKLIDKTIGFSHFLPLSCENINPNHKVQWNDHAILVVLY